MNAPARFAVVRALAIVLFLAPAAGASNMAYWARVTLTSGGPTSGVYWVSLPYVYTQQDTNGNRAAIRVW